MTQTTLSLLGKDPEEKEQLKRIASVPESIRGIRGESIRGTQSA